MVREMAVYVIYDEQRDAAFCAEYGRADDRVVVEHSSFEEKLRCAHSEAGPDRECL